MQEFKTRIASELFETAIVKTEEAFVFIQAATENGADLETAYNDMKKIDDILHMKRLHFATTGQSNKTRSGNVKKKSSWMFILDGMIDGRVINDRESKSN